MKKIIIIFLILILCGCNKNYPNTIIKLNENLNIEYANKIYLYDLFTITNGTIITENYLIDTSYLGKKQITFDYKNSNNKKKKYSFEINIVDTTPPLILSESTYTIEKGETFDIKNKPLCGDNYDKNITCIIKGNYNTNKVSNYNLKFIAKDSNNNYSEKDFTLVVKDHIDKPIYNPKPKYIKDLTKTYKTNENEIGIDVSTWQGDIDFKKVKESGIDFVMIRIGYGYNRDNENILDNKFIQNIKNAKYAGLKVGIYFYSYARNETEAKNQANWVINMLNNEKLDLPIAFDWEDWEEFNSYNISFTDLNNIAKTFIETIEKKGYDGMLYGSATYLHRIWNLNDYKIWLAHYTNKTDYPNKYNMWQLTNSGVVDGIDSFVDIDILYN